MLVLSRKKNEIIVVIHAGEILNIVVVEQRGDKVRLGFDGPKSFIVHRKEVYEEIKAKNRHGKEVTEMPKPRCHECGREILEGETFHLINGMLCDKCFSGH